MKEYIEKSVTFEEYNTLIDRLLAEGKTTGENQSEAMFGYATLNRRRMERIAKTIELTPELKVVAQGVRMKMVWLVITEGWCGDAAQNIPVIEKIAAENDNIETRYILRDENPELMDRFLTEGSRSIPKLIAIDQARTRILGIWGPRPAAAREMFETMRKQALAKPLIMENLQRWYNSDKHRSIQSEFEVLLKFWDDPAVAGMGTAAG